MPVSSKITIQESKTPQQIVEQILSLRGISDLQTFLSPPAINDDFFTRVTQLFGDELMGAVEQIRHAISQNTPIIIHGDYDVDGVSATAILWETIYYDLSYENVRPFIPHRVDHGYGLSKASIDDITSQLLARDQKPGLLITVDCGITAKDSVSYAHECGYSVIVTDHHTRPENETDLPTTSSTLHSYKLCGAGVSWVLSRAIVKDRKQSESKDMTQADYEKGIDLVALATLADIQELTDCNRSLVTYGLKKLTNTSRSGLLSLYQQAGIVGKPIGTYEVGWVIAPRLNATGRLDHALDALRLLVVRDHSKARDLSQKLDDLNATRQQMTTEALTQAHEMVAVEWNRMSPIVVYGKDWHEGIIGLIAGKLAEKYKVPVLAIAGSNEGAKGSARSIIGVNIVEILRRFDDVFETMGGHSQAAGFSLSLEHVEILKQHIAQIDLASEFNLDATHDVEVEVSIPISLVTLELCEELAKIEPFGVGNSRPTFVSRNVVVSDMRAVGKTNSHLKLRFSDSQEIVQVDGIGFGLAQEHKQLSVGDVVDVVYSIEKNEFNGRVSAQMKVDKLLVAIDQ
ncbi:single-stranded-DNA-specific exonuclease RecJ [candidate division WWE3 bacterium CG_4_9_14_3_um_filter_41_6]|uniref:Single-stranded-DNA-specific exonuclease RecJ n=1 Tax=candidate division WWE3 bacterium CG_4_10_14_0_2_um_filter_41_14 TaxID=1975072 RepID=A0A2M7TJ85_UNCKA|nr:MAG: single-stranded-DNA-specific exonuclease RecJ [candidate division WWE3 bacterium CG_4_10_14_0_2_um_filter_41_14]PJA38502.1 MAG: single-stranded-DNA-specific exonuclease RecJ [candidate division WWE3 bacterium CG_4_9_14_3_um_filter_41_6]